MSIAEWFSKHPRAVTRAHAWIEERTRGSRQGCREFIRILKTEFEFPFKDHTALRDWVVAEHGFYPVVKAEKAVKAPAAVAPSFHKSDADVRRLERREDFLITCAVNNAPVESGFLAACERWKSETGGAIIVNPVRYRNPKTREESEETQEDEWWAPELAEYLLESEIRPHDYLSIMPTKLQATTSNPLPPRISGMTKQRSAVFGHPQLCMRTVATPQEDLPKILYSSGAITQKWYSDTLAGDLGHFHHGYSAIIAEIRGKKFHLREVTWDGKQFIDIDKSYSEFGISKAPPAEALVMGDIHVGLEDPDVMEATFGPDGIVEAINPRRLFLHDLFDGRTVNPHELNNRLTRAALGDKASLWAEIEATARWVMRLPEFEEIVVVPSNHDEFLMRWLQAGERHVEPQNRQLYHYLSYMMLKEHKETGRFPGVLELALRDHLAREINFLRVDQSYQVKGIELGMHGHLGPNGARGSIRNLSQIGTRSAVGHVHSPGIWQGVYAAGLSAVYRHGYNRGPSSWLQTHIAVLANGYRQMLHMITGDYRG